MSENKRTYVKPDFTMMYFKLSDNIAATGCTSSTSTSYSQQLITCIIDGSEYVFYSDCTNNVTSGYLVEYDNDIYFLWYDGEAGKIPTDKQKKILEAIKGLAGVETGTSGWHTGVASSTIQTIWTSSY